MPKLSHSPIANQKSKIPPDRAHPNPIELQKKYFSPPLAGQISKQTVNSFPEQPVTCASRLQNHLQQNRRRVENSNS
jgi:hypothetical protein